MDPSWLNEVGSGQKVVKAVTTLVVYSGAVSLVWVATAPATKAAEMMMERIFLGCWGAL